MAGGNGTSRKGQVSLKYINDSFNRYLGIGSKDAAMLKKHSASLLLGADRFAEEFYRYLYKFPATAEVLNAYQKNGGQIDHLVEKQLAHLKDVLSGKRDLASAQKRLNVGCIHYEHNIDPVWFMGAYLLYLEHLQRAIAANHTLDAQERNALSMAVLKILFRDMGLMMEGYWDAATSSLRLEQRKVANLQEQISALLTNIPQILWSVDVKNNVPLYVSPSTSQICSVEVEMPIPCLGWTHPEDRALVERAWKKALRGQRVEVESRVLEPGQEPRWFRRTFYPYADASGEVVRIDGLMDDTTAWKEMVSQLQALATTDSLTGLANRSLFHDRLAQALAMARRGRRQVVVMLMDLDHFKEINDTLGHPVGDQVLRQVAQRLIPLLRETDTLARLGGDEFAIVLSNIPNGAIAAQKVGDYITAAFTRPFVWQGNEMYLDVTIGVAVYPAHGSDADTLLSRADLAMYSAKHKHLGSVLYQKETGDKVARRLQFASELRRALEQGELTLYYQPKIDLRTRQVCGFEALMRWQHPELGLVMPGQFIETAERSGLIHPMTEWALSALAEDVDAWDGPGKKVGIALNISATSLQNPQLFDRLHRSLSNGSLRSCSDRFEIEITENTLMADIERGAHALDQLKQLGVAVAIDDFGTGYSSLSYLKRLPIRTIKLDKSFITQMECDQNDAAIVRSTIDLAHNLGCEVVAEGVENALVMDMLARMDCDGAQGFYMCRPMPATAVPAWLNDSPWAVPS